MDGHTQDHKLPEDFDWNDIYSGEEADFTAPDPLLLELTQALEPGEVLDVGCGAGGLLAALAERGWGIHGVDLAPKAIAAARKVLAQRGHQAELVAADATTWKPPKQYQLVTNSFALPLRRAEQRAVYQTIRAAVAPGGTVIIKDFDAQMSRFPAFEGIDMVEIDELREAFEGFEILRAEVVPTPVHDHGQGKLDEQEWSAALLVARRPG